ncbi:putative phosphoglycerate mutase [Kineococcus xinjiangensis]|uniref:Putative phosphoglycerate mutase n=1 Tax=Kineococcus xinjiangensis TaxID=512762 RepID=A0A2S6IMC4_9ACTN|nr:bifunctional RNase H/acid phosphatase [Kineococcus xinjiangensis]PPK95387.1 putative phosphoglycerate mutase [Kineococcus xinjiangensis]
MSARRLVVEADGGSRGNPGPAGFGALVRDPASGEVLAEVAEAIGTATNNVAEYRGLIAGLRAAAELDPGAAVEVRMDSKLVVEQMSGRWKVKHEDMRRLVDEARTVLPGGRITYTWIPRAKNAAADRLANEAMDAAAAGRSWQRAAGAAPAAPPAAPAADADPGEPVTLVLVRPGSTPLTEERRLSGRGGDDPALSERGRAEAAAAATSWEVSHADVIVTSTLRRARETARLLAAAREVEVLPDPAWDAPDLGEWEGLTAPEVTRAWAAEFAAWRTSAAVAPPQGESLDAVAARVAQARERLVRRWAGRTVVVVTHLDPLRLLLRTALDAGPAAHRRLRVDPGSRSVLRLWADGGAEVWAVNRA